MLEARKDRLLGEVSLAVPTSWHVIGYLLFAALAAALTFLALASYSRVETVGGAVVMDKGTAPIMPTRAGVITGLEVVEGQQVEAGRLLARVRSEEDLASGATAPRRVLAALKEQDRQLESQASLLLGATAAERSRLEAAISGARLELHNLDQQIGDQLRLLQLAETDYRQIQGIAAKGFLSRRDVEAREASLLGRRQQLAQLRQARAAKLSSLAETQRAAMQVVASGHSQAAAVHSQRTEVAQQIAQFDAAAGYALTSPISGTVTALTARIGQPAAVGQPLMVIMPRGGQPRVELYVPTSAAGFLTKGQEVRLAVDAFPYQRFGIVRARITDISTTAIAKQTGEGGTLPIYLVTATLDRPWVEAFGRPQPLLPGMTLKARIVTQKQSLLEWLFEPVFAVARR